MFMANASLKRPYLRHFILINALVVLLCVVNEDVRAQAMPSSIEPGQLEKQFEPKFEPKVEKEEVVEPMQETQASVDGEVTFTLNGITLSDNTIFDEPYLREAYAEYLEKEVSFATLNDIAIKITQIYRDAGYVLARAYIPPQKVEGGVVEIKVVEGFIGEVILEGDIQGDKKLLEAYAERMKSSKPLHTDVLERYMLLMDDLPGVTARGLLRPSEDTLGAADLVITLQHKSTEFTQDVNNRGTRFLGPVQFSGAVYANSLFGQYERVLLRAITVNQPKELKYFNASYSHPLNDDGTQLNILFARTVAQPGSTLKSSEIESENISGEVEVTHPVIRSREENLIVRSAVSVRESETLVHGALNSSDSVRVIRIGAQYDKVDSWDGVNLVDFEISQGLDILRATNEDATGSRSNAGANFTKGVVNLSRYQPLPEKFALSMTAVGQYASEPLLSSEEMGIGGSEFGKAYDPSEITGDHGAAGKIELQYNKYVGHEYLLAMQAYSFFDGGAVWNEDNLGSEEARSTLASAGVGMRYNFSKSVSGYTELSFPLTRRVDSSGPDDNHEPRFFFSLAKRW